MVNKTKLSEAEVGANVSGWVYLQRSKTSIAKNGTPFIGWEGLDAAGQRLYGTYFAKGRNEVLPQYAKGSVLQVTGVIGAGEQGSSVWAQSISLVDDPEGVREFKVVCFPAVPKEELDGYISALQTYANSITNIKLLTLSQKMFEFMLPYLPMCPAGKSVHEPVRGGLAKHTYEVVSLVDSQILLKNKGLNRDVLIFSALYHDIGKTQEYTEDLAYSPNGRLISHSSLAIQIITSIIIQHQIAVDPDLLRQVKHCLLSHHGEFSEIKPATKEALALCYADIMMAKIGNIEEMVRSNKIGQDGWGTQSFALGLAPYVPELDDRIK